MDVHLLPEIFLMNTKIFDLIQSIKSEDHYLRRPSIVYDFYIDELSGILGKLEKILNSKQYMDLVDKKLQIKLHKFNELQFIQSACELTVMSHFLGVCGVSFEYEKVIGKPKNVDFSILRNGRNYNIEVKCPSFNRHEKIDGEIELHCIDRAPSMQFKNEILELVSRKLEICDKKTIEIKNLDNTLKDFLISTQEKVKKSSLEDVNILVVGCDDEANMHMWRGYLLGSNGFFTENSFINHDQFDRVDYVLLTNIYNRHYRYFEGERIINHWSLSASFNLLYPNKFSRRNVAIDGEIDLNHMNSIFPNHNIEFEKYLNDVVDVPDGEKQEIKKLVLGVAWYADKYRKNGIYYFNKHPPVKSVDVYF